MQDCDSLEIRQLHEGEIRVDNRNVKVSFTSRGGSKGTGSLARERHVSKERMKCLFSLSRTQGRNISPPCMHCTVNQ